MMLFKVEFTMEQMKTAVEKRAFMSGLYYAMQNIQAYSAELYFSDSVHSEVPAERLKTMAEDLMKVMQKVMAEAQAMEKAEEERKAEEMRSQLVHPSDHAEEERWKREHAHKGPPP